MIFKDDISTTSSFGLIATGQIKSGSNCLSSIIRMAETTGTPQWVYYTAATTPLYWNSMDVYPNAGNYYVFTCGSKGIMSGAYPIF